MIDFNGIEFDWFAIDKQGNIAVFATGGNGIIPMEVLKNHSKHIEISETIEQPHWGTGNVWRDFSVKGLYVFDWSNNEYLKVEQPKNPPSEKFLNSIMAIKDILQFDVDFGDVSSINIEF